MRTVLFLSLLLAGTAFSQSKSELKAQVASYQQRLDSMNLVLEKTQRINDSLSSEIRKKENSLKDKQATLDYRTRELEVLNTQIESLKSPKKEEPVYKLPKVSRKDNPFGTGGGNGSGNSGKKTGDDNGVSRRLIKNPDVSKLFSKESCTIVFLITVDQNGEILGIPEVNRAWTTTSDEELIKKVSELVKSQAKYNPVKWEGNTEMSISIRVYPD
jgi:hypothetical protein